MVLFRIELAFDGEEQHIGLFNGIYEALSENMANQHLVVFKNLLKIPNLPPQSVRYHYWFTQNGMVRCWQELKRLIEDMSENNWSFLVKTVYMEMPNFRIASIYFDDYQAAIPDETVKNYGPSALREVEDVRDFELILEPFIKLPLKPRICPTCKTFFNEDGFTDRETKQHICPDCFIKQDIAVHGGDKKLQARAARLAWMTRRAASL